MFPLPVAYPFEALRRVREDGTEYWSARDLMQLMGYSNWQNFDKTISRAMDAISSITEFSPVRELVTSHDPLGTARSNYEISRKAALMVLFSCNGEGIQEQSVKAHLVGYLTGDPTPFIHPQGTVRGQVYVLELASGLIKVGRSRSITVRLSRHSRKAESRGEQIKRKFVSDECMFSDLAERNAHARIMQHAGVRLAHGKETFAGIRFDRAVSIVRKEVKKFA